MFLDAHQTQQNARQLHVLSTVVDDFPCFDCSSPFCLLLIEFYCAFSISY